MRVRRFAPFCVLFWATCCWPRQTPTVCGTHALKSREELHLHRQAAAARRLERRLRSEAVPAAKDIGEIAVLSDGDGVVSQRNPFNLTSKVLSFLPSETGRYRFSVGELSYDEDAATRGEKLDGLDDDDSRRIDLPFAFPFFSQTYRQAFVNYDGNITFVSPDFQSTERSLGRLTAGPPRIAPFFTDLDPGKSTQGVRVYADSGRVVITWLNVPEYRESGTAPPQTIQLRMFSTGRIEFAFRTVSSTSAVVGIGPGSLKGSSATVSFLAGSSLEYPSTVAERFTASIDVDLVTASQKFFETHEDSYDFLYVFNNMGIGASGTALAYDVTVRSNRRGIGADESIDDGAIFGSRSRLQAAMNMGALTDYPVDPYGIVSSRFFARDTPMSILGHEAGHLFLAFASTRTAGRPAERPLLCSDGVHWAFAFNAEASLLSGNRIRDNGTGASPRFTTIATVESYSPLDQYLMGFRPPSEVPPVFLVANPTTNGTSCLPRPGVSFDGRREDVLVDDIIGVEGRRTPDHTVSQRRFRFAFALITKGGADPTPEQLAQIDGYRKEYEKFYPRVTSERAVAETSLKRSLKLSVFPGAGVLAGASLPVTLSVEKVLSAPLAVTLKSAGGSFEAPATVTIAAGATETAFTLQGIREGADALSAEPADGRYETAWSPLQVLGSASSLRLVVASGDRQVARPGTALLEPLVVRAADINDLPYAGLRIAAAATDGGTVSPASEVTDGTGRARFLWTPGSGAVNQLRFSLEGGPAVTATALGRPLINSDGVVNSASLVPRITPGSLATIYGSYLTGAEQFKAAPPYPERLGGVRVILNGRPVQVYSVGDGQVWFLVPAATRTGFAGVIVETEAGSSEVANVPVVSISPGIFFDHGTELGSVRVKGTSRTTAVPGDILEIDSTGLGELRDSPTPGLQETVARVEASIGGVPAEVVFSGGGDVPGMYQVNIRVPEGLAAGSYALALTAEGVRSNEVRVLVTSPQ